MPAEYDHELFRRLRDLPSRGSDMNIRAPHARSPAEPSRDRPAADLCRRRRRRRRLRARRSRPRHRGRRRSPRRRAFSWCAATARAWRSLPARSPSSLRRSRSPNFRPGTASPMTAPRRMPGIVAQRMTALARLARLKGRERRVGGAHDRQRRSSSGCRRAISSPGRRSPPRPATCWRWTASSAGSSSTATCGPQPCAKPANTRCAAASSICFRPA